MMTVTGLVLLLFGATYYTPPRPRWESRLCWAAAGFGAVLVFAGLLP